MNEGYKQASEISRNLILTFVFGIIIGTVIGWGARSTLQDKSADVSPETKVARSETPAEAPGATASTVPEPTEPGNKTPEHEASPVNTPPVNTSQPSFDADVAGLWPAGHLFTGIKGTKADVDTLEWLNEFKPGGVVLGPENVADPLQLADLVLQIKQAVGLGTKITDPPFIIFEDPEHALPRIFSTEGDIKSPATAATQAQEAFKQGVGVFLGPSLDIFSPGVSEARLESVSLGTTPETVSGPGLDYASQLVRSGLIVAPREFPGAGLAVKTEEGVWSIPADQIDALADAMQPFKSAMDAGIPAIVVGQMAIPGIDKDRPKRPAALSPKLLQILVRRDWQYNGLLIASDITRSPMTRDLPRDEIALKALFSGCDAVILKDVTSSDLRAICNTFIDLAGRKDFPSVQLAASRQRIKDALGHLGTPSAELQLPVTQVAAAAQENPAPAPAPDTTTPAPVPGNGPEAPVAPATTPTAATGPTETGSGTTAVKPDETPVTTPPTPAPDSKPEPPAPAPEASPAPPAPVVKTEGENKPAPEATPAPAEASTVPAVTPPAPEPAPAPAPETTPAPVETPAPAAPAAPATPAVTPETPAPSPEAVATTAETPSPAPDANKTTETEKPREHTVVKGDSLNSLARHYKVSVEDLRAWNGLENDVVKIGQVVKLEAPAADAKSAEVKPEATPTPPVAKEPVTATQPPDTDKREHTVAAGETLGAIAGMYGVTVAEIQAWNNLDPGETVINAGAALVLYLPVALPDDKKASPEKPAAPENEAAAPALEPGTFEIYEVAPGDNLRRIAQRFGTTQQKLVEMNNLKSADMVQLGWKLKVPKQATPPAAPLTGSTP